MYFFEDLVEKIIIFVSDTVILMIYLQKIAFIAFWQRL